MSKALQKTNAQIESNVIYANFKKNKPLSAKGIYNKNYDRWKNILRADSSGKKLAAECLFYIAAIEFLFLKNANEVIFDSTLLKKKSDHKQKQRSRFLKQLGDLYNIQYHHSYVYGGEQVYGKFVCTRTKDCQKLLEDPTKFYEEKCLQNDCSYSQIRLDLQSNLTGPIYIGDKVEKEEDPLGLSSSFSSLCSLSPQEGKTDYVAMQNADRTTTTQKEPQEERTSDAECRSLSVPYGAAPCLSENNTELTLTPEQEKEHYIKHKSRDSSNNQPTSLSLVLANMQQYLPITANQNEEDTLSTQCQQEKDTLSTAIVTQDTSASEEVKVNTDKPQQLQQEIFKLFNSRTSEGIMENCTFIELEPNKLGISLQAEFKLSEEDKGKLRTCIRMVYGSDVQMVSTAVAKREVSANETKQEEQRPRPSANSISEWDKFKVKIAEYFPENQYNHVMNTWLDHLRHSHSSQDKLVVVGRSFYIDEICNRFASAIEQVVAKTRKSLVFQYEGNAQRPIEFDFNKLNQKR